jgi:hypothetical protein
MKTDITINLRLDISHTVLKFVNFMCEELDITPSQIIVAVLESGEALGLCIDLDPDRFLILVDDDRPHANVFNTISHEMIHVKQYIKEDLGSLLDTCNDIPYMDRWWEKEAYENSSRYLEKFLINLKDSK